jgi:hypothetical protein
MQNGPHQVKLVGQEDQGQLRLVGHSIQVAALQEEGSGWWQPSGSNGKRMQHAAAELP